jgi:hypothetical protein
MRILKGNMIAHELIIVKEMIFNSRMDECDENILVILDQLGFVEQMKDEIGN